MEIPRIVVASVRAADLSRLINHGAIRNAAIAVERDRANAMTRDQVRQAVERAALSSRLMQSVAG